ncbi:MAG TPA: hypothetical protein VES67_18170 [Vicinamibacterales bacterium]|nr:hypothetical protein [Vicinamibacterales bacterium]
MRTLFAAALSVLATIDLPASGAVGIFGIIEKVVFEPNERAPERVQVWGAFAYVDGAQHTAIVVSTARRGYLYFKLPSIADNASSEREIAATKVEWSDLQAVAGTGQAVGFGEWGYVSGFGKLAPDARPVLPAVILERKPGGGRTTDLRVRPASELPTAPATYHPNAGVVKLPETGNHAAVVKDLRAALKR